MVAVSTRYVFVQHFRVSSRQAFDWCTDYTSHDHELMGIQGSRRVTRVSSDTMILDDTVYSDGRPIRKRKLVRLDPERMTYYNVHLTGPTRNSLYSYQILPDGDVESKLVYTAYEVYYPRLAPTKQQVSEMVEGHSIVWRREWESLAKAMEAELRPSRRQ
jgi:hypothetical protein